MKKIICTLLVVTIQNRAFCWGFFAHQKINYYAVFLLPPEMLTLYKPSIAFLSEHASDPDKKRYVVGSEAPHHYIDIDYYGRYPFDSLPRKWAYAVNKFSADTLKAHGIVPWWIQTMLQRLTSAFREKDQVKILKYSADIGHYIADAHVPLHASSNHNGQLTGQQGIHAFWESRIPELLAEKEWDFFMEKAVYISRPDEFIWKRILESAAAADTVLKIEKELSAHFPKDRQYAFEERNGKLVKQYASDYAIAYNNKLNNMIERRMRQSVFAVASFWYTAWVNAGQPDLGRLVHKNFSEAELKVLEALNMQWKLGSIKGRSED
jgi:hypothetical protein